MEETVLAALKGSDIKGSDIEGWDLEVEIHELNRCTNIEISAMYDYPEPEAKVLEVLGQIFAPRKVEQTHRWMNAGCDTCNWGSEYTLEFDVEKPEVDE